MNVSADQTNSILPAVNSPTAKINKAQNSERLLQDETQKLAQDIYHKDKAQEAAVVYDKMLITSGSVRLKESFEETIERDAIATGQLYFGEVPKTAEKMIPHYDQFMSELTYEAPELAEKDLGISINAKGSLEVSGTLSTDEKTFLEEKLNSNEKFVGLAQDFKANFLKHVERDTNAWGKYEINQENFGEVIDLKDMLEDSKSDEEFKNLWRGKSFNVFEYINNMGSQIKHNAQMKKNDLN